MGQTESFISSAFDNNTKLCKALLIGINYTGTSQDLQSKSNSSLKNLELNGCINDVENLVELLTENELYSDDDITVMTDNLVGTNLYPTKQNILDQIQLLIDFANQHPTESVKLFLSYSGHGSQSFSLNRKEIDGRDEVLCPIDYLEGGYIVDDDIRVLLDKLPSNAFLTFICDSCNSGTICDLRYSLKYSLRTGDYDFLSDYNYKDTISNVVVFSGCRDDQTSADAYQPTSSVDSEESGSSWKLEYEYQGAMTASFIKNYTPELSYKELLQEMRKYLSENNYTQVPQLSSGRYMNPNSLIYL